MITEAIELWKQNAITSWMNFDVKTEKIWSATHSSSRGLWRSSLTRGPLTKSAKQSGSWNPNNSKQRPMKLWGIHTQSEPFDVGLLKIQFLHPQKKPEEGRPKCAFSSPGPTFLRHFLVGQFCAQNKNPTPPFLKLLKVWDKRSDFGMAHNDASTLQFIETGQVLGAQREGFPLWFQVSWEFKVPPHLPQETSP